MITDATPTPPEPGPDAGIDELQADIEITRHQLGETVAALSAKADVSGRAKQKVADTVADTKDAVAEKASEATHVVAEKAHIVQTTSHDAVIDDDGSVRQNAKIAALAAVGIAAVVGVVVWRRRR